MAETTLGTIDNLLEGALADVEDSEVRYKLKSARQLVQVVQQRNDDVGEAIHEAVSDEDVLANLRDMGYIE